jgi:beta-phosphoglucomutase-like phosphatase (HAD superfamily)
LLIKRVIKMGTTDDSQEIIKRKPNRQRNNKITFRLDDNELIAFKGRLAASSLTQEAYLRQLAVGQSIIVIDGLPEAFKELRAIGNNINQLARAVNSGKTNAAAETEELVNEVRNIWHMLKSLKKRD